MSTTSFLYHAFKTYDYKYKRAEYGNNKIIFYIEHKQDKLCCPECQSKNIILRGKKDRFFKSIPIGKRNTILNLGLQRVECKDCGTIKQAKTGFAKKGYSYTKQFANYALYLCQYMTIKDVALHLNVSWDLIKKILKKDLKKKYGKPKLKKLKTIAIDEISIGKGHKYLTVVLDLETGVVVYVGKGKGKKALTKFWKRLNSSKAKIEAVAIDMSPAYISAVEKNLRNAKIVFDHFHVIKLFNDKLSNYRRKLYNEANSDQQKVLKGARWLLLKNPENLSKIKNETKRLEKALRLNEPLKIVYYMKEDLREFWNQSDKENAISFLDDWITRANISGITMLKSFAKTLESHRKGLIAYYDYPISTGPLEGTNNKIKTMKRQAYGYRDEEFLKLKIYAIHKAKYAIIG